MEKQLEFYSSIKKLKKLRRHNKKDTILELLSSLSKIDLIEILKNYYYKNYKTGLTFKRVRQMLYQEQTRKINSGDSMFVTRHTVLGRWHQIKQLQFQSWYHTYFENLGKKSKKNIIKELLDIIDKSTS